MKIDYKKSFISILFFSHLIIVILWFGLFFVPTDFWPWRISFHFRYILTLLVLQLLWSLVIYKKFNLICALTTRMQCMRGYGIYDKKNYGHSFIAELLQRLRIRLNFQIINILLLLTFILAALKYFSVIR